MITCWYTERKDAWEFEAVQFVGQPELIEKLLLWPATVSFDGKIRDNFWIIGGSRTVVRSGDYFRKCFDEDGDMYWDHEPQVWFEEHYVMKNAL